MLPSFLCDSTKFVYFYLNFENLFNYKATMILAAKLATIEVVTLLLLDPQSRHVIRVILGAMFFEVQSSKKSFAVV